MNQSDFWIMRPFNPLFCVVFGAFLLLLIAASLLVRGKSGRIKKTVLVTACLLTLIGFFVYKYYLSLDADYDRITAGMGGFNWWGELPLQLCNINMILIAVAVLLDSRPLMSFCFFLGPLGAMMALVMPGNGFEGYSLLLPRMLGYYGTHFMIVIEALALATFGLYRPKFRDLPKTFLTIFLVALAVFCINMLLRVTGLHPKANYFYSVETEGNFLLDLFHKWIPVPFLYLLPSFVILGVYACPIILGFTLADRIKGRKKDVVPV
jgi:uncharacterized membrane protein YwaF